MNADSALPGFIVKFIRHLYESGISYAVMRNLVSAISKYHIKGETGLTIGKHPLVTRAKKAFWQLKPPLPKYCGTWDIQIVLRLIESLGENDSLTLSMLSTKTAFLLAFSTLSRCCLPQLSQSSIFLSIELSSNLTSTQSE